MSLAGKEKLNRNMPDLFKNHPFAVEAFFESSLVLTFAIPKYEIQHLIPECLELDTFQEHWAFIAVAMVQTRDLRPKGFPRLLGNDFFLIGYRVFVRYTTSTGKRWRGLYILKSETDKKKMEVMGNFFTHYRYCTTDIQQQHTGSITEIDSIKSDFHVKIEFDVGASVPLPNGSPFATWAEARRYAGPLPFTFTYNPANQKVLIIEGVRKDWDPSPVKVIDFHISFLEQLKLKDVRLANAFMVRNIPYYWKKGKTDQWIRKEENFRVSSIS